MSSWGAPDIIKFSNFYNLKMRDLGVKVCVAFYYFDLERNYDVLSLEVEPKMENPTYTFGEMNLVL